MTPCREWTGALNNMGYGVLRREGRNWLVHRWVAHLAGEDVEGKLVLHQCDNPRCYRLDHLFLGTHKDNTQDMVRKGRARGNTLPNARRVLTDDQVIQILESTESARALGRQYGVSHSVILEIRHGRTYKEIRKG